MPLTEGDIVVITIMPTVDTNEKGVVVRMTSAEFTVRGQGPYSQQLPTDQFTYEKMQAMIREFASHVVAVLEIK